MTNDPLYPDEGPMDPGDRDELLAAEWVLGLLTDDRARQADDRLRRDPGFGRRVQDWSERLAVLAADLAIQIPSPHVKAAIDAKLSDPAPQSAPVPTAPAPPPRKAARAQARPAARTPIRRGLWLTGAAAAAAIALAWVLMPGDDFHPDYHAAPANAQLAMRIDARFDSVTREMEVQMTEGSPPPDGDMELWWIAAPDAVPVSLGVVPATGRIKVNLPPGMVPSPGVVLAVTAEPRGGSSSGLPTGPVVASAPITPV